MLIFYVLFTIALAGQTAGKLFAKHSLSATKGSASPAKPARRHLLTAFLTLLSIAAFFFGANFRATTEMTPAGRTSTTTVGSFDPLFTYEGGPSGFHYGFQFFSWSFFALIICGVSFAALLRVSREDEGKVARDPDWWRDWWKQVGIWCGLLFLACAVRTAMKSRAPASIAPMTEGANISPPQSTGRVDADAKP